VDWLIERDLLLGPFLFTDYWSSVLELEGGIRAAHREAGWVDPPLFRSALARPDLEVPRARFYVMLFLIGPFLLPFRAFRRLGRYRIRYRSGVASTARQRLRAHQLDVEGTEPGRVRVGFGHRELARDILDPRMIAGFASLFYATYKLPIVTLTAVIAMGVAAPILRTAGLLDRTIALWLPVVLPGVTVLLYLLYRDWATAVLGVVPLVVGRLLFGALASEGGLGWGGFFGALGLLLALMLVADWFLIPRPVPPVLQLFTRDEPGRPYEREDDGPYWLEGRSYWVWRYLMLVPAELNKFWERDWERAEIWIRADGPDAGQLEWVVVDGHYRELWIPFELLGSPHRIERHRARARKLDADRRPGVWLVEIDANLIFHTPFVRTVSFVPEGDAVPTRSVWHLLSGLFRSGPRDDPDDYLLALDRARLDLGGGVLDDLPEAIVGLATRHLLATPWRFWRYPLGAQRRRERRLYSDPDPAGRPPAADRALQIKARERKGPT